MKYNPYSASKIAKYLECPKKFQWRYIKKIREEGPEPSYFEKGHYFHHILNYFPKAPPQTYDFQVSSPADIRQYRETLKKFLTQPKIRDIMSKDSLREKEFIIYGGFEPDGSDNESLFRGYIDHISPATDGVATIIDWKSGRVYKDKSDDQLKLYALWLFLFDKEFAGGLINTINCIYYYVEHNVEVLYTFHKADVPDIIGYFTDQINRIEEDSEFPRNKSMACHRCYYFDACAPFNVKVKEKYRGNSKEVAG